MTATTETDHSEAYIAAMRRAAEIEAQDRVAARANAEQFQQRQAARLQRLNAAKQRLNAALAWCRANPKAVLIAAACALTFNFVLYPLMHETRFYSTYSGNIECDYMKTGTAVVLCHLAHGPTFLGSWLR
jgi:hypothetical protein